MATFPTTALDTQDIDKFFSKTFCQDRVDEDQAKQWPIKAECERVEEQVMHTAGTEEYGYFSFASAVPKLVRTKVAAVVFGRFPKECCWGYDDGGYCEPFSLRYEKEKNPSNPTPAYFYRIKF